MFLQDTIMFKLTSDKKIQIILQTVFFKLNLVFNCDKSFQKLLEDLSIFSFSCATYAFPCLSQVLGNIFWQSPIGDFAEYLLLASRSYQLQKKITKNLVQIV